MTFVAGGADSRSSNAQPRRRRRRLDSGRRERLGIALLAISLIGSALLFGAQQTPVLVAAALAAAGAAWLLRRNVTSYATWLLVGLAIYTLCQIVPMPAAWIQWLSPASAAVWQGALRPFGETSPAWVTLSVDPAATALEALKSFAYVCVFVAACGWRERRGSAGLAVLIFGCGALVTFVTLAHGVLDLQRVYGMFVPPTPLRWSRGPFVNGNNLAGYVNLALFAGVGLWLSPERKLPAWPFLLGIPILAAQVLLSESRGGILCLVLGTLWLGYRTLRQQRIVSGRLLASVAAAVMLSLVAALAVGSARLPATLSDLDMRAKVSVWWWSLDMIRDFPLFGVGRGAFETAFEPYRRLLGHEVTMVFPYAENFLLQWVTDWGVLVAVVAFAAGVALVWRPLAGAVHEPLASGIATGLGAILLQNLVDLGLEIFGVSALALVAFAAVGGPSESGRRGRDLGALIAIPAVLVTAGIVVALGATPVRIERQQVSKAYSAWVRNGAHDPAGFLRTLRIAMLRHPGEAYFPLVGSVVAARAGGDPMKWIGRAVERSPLDGHVHMRLAEVMETRGARQQALLHLRLAAVYDVVLRDGALWKASWLARGPEDLSSAFPSHLPGATLLPDVCRRAVGPLRTSCWREVVVRDGGDPVAKRELVAALLEALEVAVPPCAGDAASACKEEVRRRLSEAEVVLKDWRVSELRARELALDGNVRQAAVLVLEHCPATQEAAPCCERAVDFARRSKDLALLGAAADRYSAAACNDPRACAVAHARIGGSYQELSAFGTALKHYSMAAEEDPSADRWIQTAEAAARAGSAVSARFAFDRARREGDLNVEQRRRIEAVEATLGGILHGN